MPQNAEGSRHKSLSFSQLAVRVPTCSSALPRSLRRSPAPARAQEEREGFYHSEWSYGSFARTIPLPEGALADNAEATFRDGVLAITIPAPPNLWRHRGNQIQKEDRDLRRVLKPGPQCARCLNRQGVGP